MVTGDSILRSGSRNFLKVKQLIGGGLLSPGGALGSLSALVLIFNSSQIHLPSCAVFKRPVWTSLSAWHCFVLCVFVRYASSKMPF